MTDTSIEPTPELERAWDRLVELIAEQRDERIDRIMGVLSPADVTYLFDVALRAQHDE